MYRSSYLHAVHKEKYEQSEAYEELPESPEFGGLAQTQGLENLQDLSERFANYINRARVLEQRNSIFRKQLETFQRMDELVGLEDAFAAQIDLNHQRVRDLATNRSKLEREKKDAQRMLDEYCNKYKNECEYQKKQKSTLEELNKEADEALLCNLELQIESQFLQDDVNATKDRYKKNLMEVQTYIRNLEQIVEATPQMSTIMAGGSEEKLITERRIPILQNQLDEYKGIFSQLQGQKLKLQTETAMLDQVIKDTQQSYNDEIHLYNDQIDSLRKSIEDAERTLEKYTNQCRQLSIYKQSLESELERYKRVIENEDSRLNSAIVGTPATLFPQTYRPPETPPLKGTDITLVMQDIAAAKFRQRSLPKKMFKRKEITPKDLTNGSSLEKTLDQPQEGFDQVPVDFKHEESEHRSNGTKEESEPRKAEEDVPDGAQLSKAFDKLCNIVKDKVRCYQRQEPRTGFHAKGYVVIAEKGSYDDTSFHSLPIPYKGRVIVSDVGGNISRGMKAIPELPRSPEHCKSEVEVHEMRERSRMQKDLKYEYKLLGKEKDDDGSRVWRDLGKKQEFPKVQFTGAPEPFSTSCPSERNEEGIYVKKQCKKQDGLHKELAFPNTMSYEKVEMVESIEKFSDDKIESYEETAMIMETMTEKTSKKKLEDKKH
ncbi:PREDICTED: filensin [Thamnophis sirtalis]|uniref:Filensin n=1 Tax=Thamnophis sirtalis TaxID=35019 RepID=A0A6I9XI22_9SAUR|nr:PREDICTED: filensin [Thamnophis sirtalis]